MTETDLYFSERETGLAPRLKEEIDERVWRGLVAIVKNLISTEAFGAEFPSRCGYDPDISGMDKKSFNDALFSDTGLEDSGLDYFDYVSHLSEVMNLIEFCYKHVAKPTSTGQGSCWNHSHFSYDREEGQKDFRKKINRLFGQHGLAYQLQENGQVIRLVPFAFQEALQLVFQTGDTHLDEMLETARTKYLNPEHLLRREALEKLWDAWECLKTVDYPSDKPDDNSKKKISINILLDKASTEPYFRALLEVESIKLNEIGNNFKIRHFETNKTLVDSSDHIDYLFLRMFTMIHLLLKART